MLCNLLHTTPTGDDADLGLQLLVQQLYHRGLGKIATLDAIRQLTPPQLSQHLVQLLRRWGTVRNDDVTHGVAIWVLVIDEAQLAPRAVSAMLRAIFRWNFPSATSATGTAPFSGGVAIIPIVIGTSAAEINAPDLIRATGYSPWKDGALCLPFLAPFKSEQLLQHLLAQLHVRASPFLTHLAGEFSGWPIAFAFLYSTLHEIIRTNFSMQQPPFSLTKELCETIYTQVRQQISTTYSEAKLGMRPEYLKQVMLMSVVGAEVSRRHIPNIYVIEHLYILHHCAHYDIRLLLSLSFSVRLMIFLYFSLILRFQAISNSMECHY